MSKGLKLITALVIVAIIAVVAIVVTGRDTGEDTTATNTDGSSESADDVVTITYDGTSFSPAEVRVESGGTVKFVNESDTTIEPSSDNHPTHEANPEINFGEIEPGESSSVSVSEEGSWEYHDHLNPDNTGMIIVE